MKNTASKPSHDGDNQRHTQPHRQPQQQPPATTAAPPPPAAVPTPRSESSDSVSSSSSSSWSTSLHVYGGGTVDSTSTSTSTAAFKSRGGKAAGRKRRRRQSDTTYPGRRKRSSSTDTGVRPEPQRRTSSKFWLYTVVAVMLTVATVSAIGMSLRGADTMTDEPQEYILPKRAKTTATPPQCNCTNGSASNAANPDAAAVLRRRLTSSEPERRRTTAESPDKSAAAAGGGNASAVVRPDGEKDDAAPDDGVPQKKVAGKATRSFVAYKIGPGRRKHAGSSVTSQTPAIPNHTGLRPASQRPEKRGPQGAPTTSPGALKNAPRRTEKTVAPTSATNTSHHPTLKTATYVMPEVEEAADWEQERPLVNEYGKRRSSSAAAGKPREVGGTPEVGASNAARRSAAAGTA